MAQWNSDLVGVWFGWDFAHYNNTPWNELILRINIIISP